MQIPARTLFLIHQLNTVSAKQTMTRIDVEASCFVTALLTVIQTRLDFVVNMRFEVIDSYPKCTSDKFSLYAVSQFSGYHVVLPSNITE